MAYKMLDPPETAIARMAMLDVADHGQVIPGDMGARRVKRGQFQALRRDDGTWVVEIAPGKPSTDAASGEAPAHVANLCNQIDALNRQIAEHSAAAGGIVVLLRQMIEARERELDLWLARDEGWERRLATIESAICERDEARRREAALVRERDDARRAAMAALVRIDELQRAAEAARREMAAAQTLAEKANAEQLRLRAEREIDRSVWGRERRQLIARLEQLADRGWLSRLTRGRL